MNRNRRISRGRIPGRPRQQGGRISPFHLIVALAVLLGLGLLAGAFFGARALINSRPTATPTLTLAPTITLAPSATTEPTLTPTPPTRACRVVKETQAHAEPKQDTVLEDVPAEAEVQVIEVITAEGQQWYKVFYNGVVRYMPFDSVRCQNQ